MPPQIASVIISRVFEKVSRTIPGRHRSIVMEEISRRKFPRIHTQLWLLLKRGIVKYMRAFWPLRILGEI